MRLCFRLFGISLASARLVAAAAIMFLGCTVYWITARLAGLGAARLALLWLLAFHETWLTGRQTLGDYTASAFALLGAYALTASGDRWSREQAPWRPWLAGAWRGLARVTTATVAAAMAQLRGRVSLNPAAAIFNQIGATPGYVT